MRDWVPPGSADRESEQARAADAPVTDEPVADDGGSGQDAVVRHEEELDVRVEAHETGTVDVRKRVEHEHVSELVPRSIEHFDEVERTAAHEGDSGEVEVLPDGSVSVPILEEELVIQKRTVVRERVIVRKRTETRSEQIDTTLRKERVDVEGVDSDA